MDAEQSSRGMSVRDGWSPKAEDVIEGGPGTGEVSRSRNFIRSSSRDDMDEEGGGPHTPKRAQGVSRCRLRLYGRRETRITSDQTGWLKVDSVISIKKFIWPATGGR